MHLITEGSFDFCNVESSVLALAVTTAIVTVNARTCSCPSSPMFYWVQPDADVQLGWATLLTGRPLSQQRTVAGPPPPLPARTVQAGAVNGRPLPNTRHFHS